MKRIFVKHICSEQVQIEIKYCVLFFSFFVFCFLFFSIIICSNVTGGSNSQWLIRGVPHIYIKHICGSPGQKSNIIPSRILSASPSLTRYCAELPLRVGPIRASQTHQISMHLHSTHESRPQWKLSAIVHASNSVMRSKYTTK